MDHNPSTVSQSTPKPFTENIVQEKVRSILSFLRVNMSAIQNSSIIWFHVF